jgi:16S rRNA (uracil1498-N3)-methyltransferase
LGSDNVIRLYVEDALGPGGRITLRPDQGRYLTAVMRLRAGDGLLVFNGRDGEWRARLLEASQRSCALGIETLERPQASGPDLDLMIALVKRGRLETIVEKAAELGARRVLPLITERTNARGANIERLSAIAAEGAEQTGRLDVPSILAPAALDRVLAEWPPERRLMFCDEAGEAPPAMGALRAAGGGPWAILIGPEGGFSSAERARIRALAAVTAVSLGPRILRADTAAIGAMTLWQAALGDWRA